MCMPYPFTDVRKNSTKSRRCQQWGIFACRCHRTSPRMSSGFYWESPRSPSTGDPTLPARPSDGSERYHRFLPYLVASTHPTSNDYKFTIKMVDTISSSIFHPIWIILGWKKKMVETTNHLSFFVCQVFLFSSGLQHLQPKIGQLIWKKKRKTLRMERFKQPGQCWRLLPAYIRWFQVL